MPLIFSPMMIYFIQTIFIFGRECFAADVFLSVFGYCNVMSNVRSSSDSNTCDGDDYYIDLSAGRMVPSLFCIYFQFE